MRQPMFYLIDDDQNSAAFLMRKLDSAESRFGVQCQWFNSAESGHEMMMAISATSSQDRPDLVIVDLKSSSQANENFLVSVAEIARSAGVPLVTMVNSADTDKRAALRRAGADEIFKRPADVMEYRSEVERLIEFSAQSKRAG